MNEVVQVQQLKKKSCILRKHYFVKEKSVEWKLKVVLVKCTSESYNNNNNTFDLVTSNYVVWKR